MRGCPQCLRQDAEGGSGPAHLHMAMRGHWLVPHVTLCLEHLHPIVPLWRESQPGLRFDSAARLEQISGAILSGEFDTEGRSATDFDLWMDQRLEGAATNTWLDQFPLHAAANFCLMLGNSLLRHYTSAPSAVPAEDRWAIYQMGFEVACEGETAIHAALQGLQDIPGGPQDGARKIFPMLYDRLAYDYAEDPDYALFRDLLRTHMMQTWPLGIGDDLLGVPVTSRRLHSIRTAAQETGIDQRRLRKMLAAQELVPIEGRPDAWEVFDAEAARPVLDEARSLVTAKSFASLIGASRSQFDLLVADGILQPALTDARTNSVWDPQDGRRFLESVFAGAIALRQAQHSWIHISKSAQRLKIRPGKIIELIRAGKLTRIGNHADFDGYKALYVDHNEVTSMLSTNEPPAQSIEIFAKAAGVNQPSRMRRLIVNGHTSATMMRNPKTNAEQKYISPEDAKSFHRTFFTPRTMALAYQRSWQSLLADLRARKVSAFSPDGEDYGSVFLRSEVEAAIT